MKKNIIIISAIVVVVLIILIILSISNKKAVQAKNNDVVSVTFEQISDESKLTKETQDKIVKLKPKTGAFIIEENESNLIMISKGRKTAANLAMKVLDISKQAGQTTYRIQTGPTTNGQSNTPVNNAYSYILVKFVGEKGEYVVYEDNGMKIEKAAYADTVINK